MASKKKKKGSPKTENTDLIQTDQVQTDLSPVFDQAALEAQKKRHESIGTLFDKASEVISNYLGDPNIESVAKMLPAKLALDLYTAQEKFKREDDRIEIERRKLVIEEKKANIPSLPGGTFNQQNNFISASPADMAELKKKQDQLLASFRPKTPANGDDN